MNMSKVKTLNESYIDGNIIITKFTLLPKGFSHIFVGFFVCWDKTSWGQNGMVPLCDTLTKSHTTLQNKVRLKVLPEQLTLFVNTSVTFKKMYHSIVFYYTVLIIAQKYTLFHIPAMKNIVKGLK